MSTPGSVVATHVWPSDADVPVAVDPLELDWGGPVGDRHHGLTMLTGTRQRPLYPRGTEIRNYRQLSIVSVEELAETAAALGVESIPPGTIADNLCLAGIPALTSVPATTRLVFGSGVVVVVGGVNDPCTVAGEMVQAVVGTGASRFPKAAWGRRGVIGWVEHPGRVRPGDTVELR